LHLILKQSLIPLKENIKGRIHTDNFLIPLKTSKHSMHVKHNQNHENNNNHKLNTDRKTSLWSGDAGVGGYL